MLISINWVPSVSADGLIEVASWYVLREPPSSSRFSSKQKTLKFTFGDIYFQIPNLSASDKCETRAKTCRTPKYSQKRVNNLDIVTYLHKMLQFVMLRNIYDFRHPIRPKWVFGANFRKTISATRDENLKHWRLILPVNMFDRRCLGLNIQRAH